METRSSFRVSAQVVLGLFVIVLGVLFTLDNLDLLNAGDILRYWPALVIIYGLWRIITCVGTPAKVWGLFWVFVGTLLLLDKLYVLYVSIWDLWPLILVVIGAGLLLGRTGRRYHIAVGSTPRVADSNSTISAVAFLGGFKRTNDSQDFRGGEITAIMGGCEIDLRQASIQEGDAVLDLFAFWGGIELRVPADWIIVNEGVPLLGGFEDKTHPSKTESKKRLIIRGYAVMGGVEIKN